MYKVIYKNIFLFINIYLITYLKVTLIVYFISKSRVQTITSSLNPLSKNVVFYFCY